MSGGVIGARAMRTSNGVSASSIADANTAGAGITPHSPTPLTPYSFSGEGVSVWTTSMRGSSGAVTSR